MLAAQFFAWPTHPQPDWQKPNALIARAEVEKIIGAVEHAEPERDLRMVWAWGHDTIHGPGAHEYVRVRDAMVALLSQLPRVTVETQHPGPVDASALSEKRHPVAWTLEAGKGRVLGTTIGHNTFTSFDPRFRIMLFRAMAWAMRTRPDPFMPLVFAGITDDKGMVGTTNDMRDPETKAKAIATARGEQKEDLREHEPAPS